MDQFQISPAQVTSMPPRTSVAQRLLDGACIAALLMLGGQAPVLAANAESVAKETQEIVVTARKREERLLDVPVSVSHIGGVEIEQAGIENVEGLYGRVPGLYRSQNNIIGPQPDATYIVMRGVGASPAVEPSAGVFIDGVYQSSAGFDITFLDLERVEVLRGPQGTLFGRNTESGAINIVTRKPGETLEGKVQAQYDEFNTILGRFAVSGPLVSDKLFVGVAASYQETDGYLNNITLNEDQDDEHKWSARGALRFLPNDSVEINWTVDGSQRGGGIVGFGPRAILGKTYDVEDDYKQNQDVKNYGSALTVDVDLGWSQLTSITGGRYNRTQYGFDTDGTGLVSGNVQQIEFKQWNLSEELRLASPANASNFRWLVGGYLFRESEDYDIRSEYMDLTGAIFPYNIFFPGTVGVIQTQNDRWGWAIFGQGTYTLFEKLDITFGARYSWEDIEQKGFNSLVIPMFGINNSGPRMPAEGSQENFAPMGSIAYRWTDEFMTYATISKGFKAGGFKRNPGATAPNPLFQEEEALLYEGGVKLAGMNNKIQLSASVFYIDLTDQQLSTIQVIDFLPAEVIDNVGKSHTKGFDVEMSAQLMPQLTVSGALGYVKTVFDEYIDSSGVDRAGQEFPSVPSWTASFSVDFRQPINDEWSIGALASFRYVGNYFVGNGVVDSDPFFDIPSYEIVDAQISLESERWAFTVFAENLFDKYAFVNRFQGFFYPINTHTFNTMLPPRKIGARIEYRF